VAIYITTKRSLLIILRTYHSGYSLNIPEHVPPTHYASSAQWHHQPTATQAPNQLPSQNLNTPIPQPPRSPSPYNPETNAQPEGGDGGTGWSDFDTHSASSRPDLEWFDEQEYTRIVEPDAIRYVHSRAGRIIRKSTTAWEDLSKLRAKAHPTAPYFPFPNLEQWNLARWLATSKASQSKIDELLAMDGVSTHLSALYMG
jgi:hypothetical protein